MTKLPNNAILQNVSPLLSSTGQYKAELTMSMVKIQVTQDLAPQYMLSVWLN